MEFKQEGYMLSITGETVKQVHLFNYQGSEVCDIESDVNKII